MLGALLFSTWFVLALPMPLEPLLVTLVAHQSSQPACSFCPLADLPKLLCTWDTVERGSTRATSAVVSPIHCTAAGAILRWSARAASTAHGTIVPKGPEKLRVALTPESLAGVLRRGRQKKNQLQEGAWVRP